MIVETSAIVNNSPITGLCPTTLLSLRKLQKLTKPKRQKRSRYCIAAHEVMNLELLLIHTNDKANTFP